MIPKLSQNLSSNTLLHFTPSLSTLMEILTNGFQLSYVPELLSKKAPNGESVYYIVPMICFCDIPLGGIKAHLKEYGDYGLGVHKDICKFKNVNPVFYIYNTLTFKPIFPGAIENFVSIIPYVKEYNGKSVKKDKDTRFYNEREWRHVDSQNLQIIQGDRARVLGKCSELNKQYSKYLNFDLDNFEYVIVKNNTDVKHMIDMINTHMTTIAHDKKMFLCSKIISATRIKYDF